jgi:PPP family 3-phenylpropionic acid transporter
VRGAGSASFIVGLILSGRLIGISGLNSTLGLNALLLVAAAFITVIVPNRISAAPAETTRSAVARGGIRSLLTNSTFRCVLIVAALVEGSHAMHDGFAVIRWRAAGIHPFSIALLWSEGVAGEIIVFFFAGRHILDRLGPGRSLMLAAAAGVLRWGALAQATRVGVLALVEPLHGLTFALLHLACMQVIQRTVPGFLAATAQTVYGTLAVGLMTSLLTLCSGLLFARLGASGFWAMSGICLLAIPFARQLELLTNEPERS